MSDFIGHAVDGRDPDICTCFCHKTEGMRHIAPCCRACDECGLMIKVSAYDNHLDREHGAVMAGVTEYGEDFPVRLVKRGSSYVVEAKNEGGYNRTQIDFIELVNWIKANRPELLK